MNVINIILSVCASLLVAIIMIFWVNDSNNAEKQPDELVAQLEAKEAKIAELEARLKQYEQYRNSGPAGRTVRSPYGGSSLQQQHHHQKDIRDLKDNMIAKKKLTDALNLTPTTEKEDLANQKMSSSALSGATGGATDLTEESLATGGDNGLTGEENVTRSKQLQRINEIRLASVQAVVNHVSRSPDGDIYLAALKPNRSLSDGSVLSVRRKLGIAGHVKILSQNSYEAHGEVLTIEPVNSNNLVLKVGDELILPPRWQEVPNT